MDRPCYIAIPPVPPVHSPLQSPDIFYTPPTSPPIHFVTPSSSSPPPLPLPDSQSFPISIDLALQEPGLSPLDKIYLFSSSKASFHKIFILNALPSFLHHVSPSDATEFVLPLLRCLAVDQDEQVKEALASQLVNLIWWFFTHCKVIPDDTNTDSPDPTISVQAFTPILGTLLLSANPLVGRTARYAVVDLLSRLNEADNREAANLQITQDGHGEESEWTIGLFLKHEREMFRREILYQVVIGMGRLDVDIEDSSDSPSNYISPWNHDITDDHVPVVTTGEQGNSEEAVSNSPEFQRSTPETSKFTSINPYFPVSNFFISSPASSGGSTPSSTSTTDTSYSPSPEDPIPPSAEQKLTTLESSLTTNPFRQTDDRINTPETLESPTPSHPAIQVALPDNNVLSAPHPVLPLPFSPTEEMWSCPDLPPDAPDSRYTNTYDSSMHPTYGIHASDSEEDEEDEQAAVGRVSSMSLMAAVTASGSLSEDIKEAFVKEVERVGQDPVYWVRREASFALGALGKVVPEELIVCSVLPLFDTLRRDPVWHVRHSALFALPGILSRLPPNQRRLLALDAITTLSTDDSPAVRSGVLEALGEVLYTFHQDNDGPPEPLVQLFLGRKEDKRVRDGQQGLTAPSSSFPQHITTTETPLESFYTDPERPHICAFSYPAVTLTLGRDRWPELREVYLDIAANRAIKVRRTLAASLGELAKIIGKEHGQRDLVGVWWDAIRCEEEEVRTRAVDSVGAFVEVLGPECGEDVIQGLVAVWDEGIFSGWRERENIAKALVSLIQLSTVQVHSLVAALLKRALEDDVAAVREAAISALPRIWSSLSQEILIHLRGDLQSLASYVACQQALVLSEGNSQPSVPLDDDFWISISDLTDDTIIGVRIGVARLIGFISEFQQPISGTLLSLIHRLSNDPSHEVRSYVPDPLRLSSLDLKHSYDMTLRRPNVNLSTFSRPPPALPASKTGSEIGGVDRQMHITRAYNGLRSQNADTDNWAELVQSPPLTGVENSLSEPATLLQGGPISLAEEHENIVTNESTFSPSAHGVDANIDAITILVPA